MNALDTGELRKGAACAALWANSLADRPELESPDLDSETCICLAEQLDEDDGPWTGTAVAIIADVVDWAEANAADVRAYMEATGRDEGHVGHDFSLSRANHGTGLWDRGAGDVGNRLHKAAEVYGSGDLLVTLDDDGEVTAIGAM